jgi:ribosomal protein S18 acetylase RimI-like enzyme
MLASMRAFFPSVADATNGYRVIELDGVLATVTPAVPDSSLPNSVVYESEDRLVAVLDELARAYDDAGVRAWTVWTPNFHDRARAALEQAGHVLDASPEGMLLALDQVEPPREDDPLPDPNPSSTDLGAINDSAYGVANRFTLMMGDAPLDPAAGYIARVDGKPAASVVTNDHEGDCSVWWVAVTPEARGRGLAAGLMRRALHAGRERGCDASTLQATKLGRPVYERLGYRGLGPIEMWERREG